MFNPVSYYTSTTILAKPCLQKYLSQSYDSNTAKKHHYFDQNPGLKKIVKKISCNLLNSKKHMHFKDCSICMLWQNKWFHAIHLPERGKASYAVQFINFGGHLPPPPPILSSPPPFPCLPPPILSPPPPILHHTASS